MKPLNVLVIGATYGSLAATKISLAGHLTTLIGHESEIQLIEQQGMTVELPLHRGGPTETYKFKAKKGRATQAEQWGLLTSSQVVCSDYDIAFLAVPEPKISSPGLESLFDNIAATQLPFISLLNVPPLSFISQLSGFEFSDFQDVYHSSKTWEKLASVPQTVASPDAQALRVSPENPTHIKVTLAANFKCAPFRDSLYQNILLRLSSDISKVNSNDGSPVPVRLVASNQMSTPFVKLPMLVCGNYRCIQEKSIRPICNAVWDDFNESKNIYNLAVEVLLLNDVPEDIIVSFEQYAEAAYYLTEPSSVARAVQGGISKIERADLFLQKLAKRKMNSSKTLDKIVQTVDLRLSNV